MLVKIESKQRQIYYWQWNMETHSNRSTFRRQSQRNSLKRELSTSDCILQLLYYFLRLLFKGFCARNKKSFEHFLIIFCFPIIYLLRVVSTIKWRRILNPKRIGKGFRNCITRFAFRTLKTMKLDGQSTGFRIWKRKRRKSYYVGKNSYRIDIDIRNVW